MPTKKPLRDEPKDVDADEEALDAELFSMLMQAIEDEPDDETDSRGGQSNASWGQKKPAKK